MAFGFAKVGWCNMQSMSGLKFYQIKKPKLKLPYRYIHKYIKTFPIITVFLYDCCLTKIQRFNKKTREVVLWYLSEKYCFYLWYQGYCEWNLYYHVLFCFNLVSRWCSFYLNRAGIAFLLYRSLGINYNIQIQICPVLFFCNQKS